MNTYIDSAEKYDCMECDNRAVTPVNGRCPHCGSTVLVLAEEPENRVDENLTIVEGIPEWAIWYFENPNESREELEPEEREALKEFEEDYSFECIVEGSEDSFNRFPAFGLACSTVDVYAHERGKERWTEEDEEAANAELIDEVMAKVEEASLEELTCVLDISFNPGEKVGDEFELQGFKSYIGSRRAENEKVLELTHVDVNGKKVKKIIA